MENVHDVGMVKSGRDQSLAQESLPDIPTEVTLISDHLECAGFLREPIAGLVDAAHATLTQFRSEDKRSFDQVAKAAFVELILPRMS